MTTHKHSVDSPWFRAEAVPGQLEELKAETEENRVLITDGSHENTEEESLTDNRQQNVTEASFITEFTVLMTLNKHQYTFAAHLDGSR